MQTAPISVPPSAGAGRPRLAVVLSHPTQYYSPWFRWLAANTPLNLRVFYLWEFGVKATLDPRFQTAIKWDVDLLSGYEHEFVPNASPAPGAESFRGFDNPALTARLGAWRPDAILLFGYKWLSHLRVIFWARRKGVPLVFRGDSHLLGRPAPGWRRRWPLRVLFRQFAAVTYVGKANRAYFEAFGVPPSRLFFVPHAVNDAHFDPNLPAHQEAAQALRRRLQLAPETRVVLFAGKLMPEKQPRELLAAFLALAPRQAALVFVGDGPERATLAMAAQAATPGTVHLLPFANQSEMPARYLLADIFALPSRGLYETWGLAVNEAMHLGVPCLVSDRVGCQQDLVTDGETGWVFRAGQPEELKSKLAAALAADLPAFKPRVAARIAGYTYATAAAGLSQALASLARPRR
ncbi:MAG TPA: glycosyltransferase family 4 protein [Opitutaceae bacterium]|nr:glycosyltransferase family 4 protein [Opitutaceae bacterium]